MKLTSLIARRYLFSRKKITLISTLTVISIAGVTVGTALLIVVLSVFNGLFDLIKESILAHDPDIRIESAEGQAMRLNQHQMDFISNHPEIEFYSPFVEGKALIAHRGGIYKVAMVRGVEETVFETILDLNVEFSGLPYDLSVREGRPGLLIGRNLMNQMGMRTGDEIALLSAQAIQRSLTQFSGPRTLNFHIRGTYIMDQMHDDSVIFVQKEAAQRLFNMRNAISGIDIQLHDHDRAEAVKQLFMQELGDAFLVRTWYDLQKPLYDVMNLEKWGAFLILMIIVLVAAFNIVGSLTMIVVQKTRDIALLRSIGMTTIKVREIFFRQGLIIGLIGCGAGGFLGFLLCWLQDSFGLVKLAGAEAFVISAYPVSVVFTDVLLIMGGSLMLCLMASLYPAYRASSIKISEALRFE